MNTTRRPSATERTLGERINSNPLTATQMLGLAESMTALPPDNRGCAGHAIATATYFQGHQQAFELTTSAMFRLEALVRFISEEELPGWIHNDQSDGSVMTHEGLITAAGQCPIGYRQKHFRFNRKALLRLAFQFAKTARRP